MNILHLPIPEATFVLVRDFISEQEYQEMLPKLHSLEWEKFKNFPRTNVAFGKGYRYSGVTHPTKDIPQFLLDLAAKAESPLGFEQGYWNSVLLNRYANGYESIGQHSDSEYELGHNPRVIALSLGEERTFIIKRRGTQKSHSIALEHRSLLIMGDKSQLLYTHGIDKEPHLKGERISITFRHNVK